MLHSFSKSGLSKYLNNAMWLFSEKLIRLFLGLLVNAWVARHLGVEGFGSFNFIFAFNSIFLFVGTLGLDRIIVRSIIQSPDKQCEILGTAIILRLLAYFPLVLAMIVSVALTNSASNIKFLILASSITIAFQSLTAFDSFFQSQVLSRFSAIAATLAIILAGAVKIIFILSSKGLEYFVAATVIESAATGMFLSLFFFRSKYKIGHLRFSSSHAVEMLKQSFPLLATGLVVTLYMRTDQLMLNSMAGSRSVGVYSSAVRLSEAWIMIPSALIFSFFPSLVSIRISNMKEYSRRVQLLFDATIASGILAWISVLFVGNFLINLIYGSAYQEASSILKILFASSIFVFAGLAGGQYMINENYHKKMVAKSIVGLSFNVIANYLLIPRYGAVGAAYATLASQVLANFLYDYFDSDLKDLRRIKLRAFFPIHLFLSKPGNQ